MLKADHYLKATLLLHKNNFSDLCASSLFYAMYHSLLAIAAKFGYESRNQTCTFALIESLIEHEKIGFDINLLRRIADTRNTIEMSSINIREKYQYGTALSLDTSTYSDILMLAKEVIDTTKTIMED